MTATLDHIVINTRFEMDQAEEIFARLGFTLTPRGHHTLGSHNHLMMFARDYLELVGIAEQQAHMRPEIAEGPLGLDGLVFKTGDADKTYQRLETLGMAGDGPKSFSRPVTLSDGSTQDARFRTVTARADVFPAARLYFCEHLTPELVWRPEWQGHPNEVIGFSELVIVTPRPGEDAARLAELLKVQSTDAQGGGQEIALKEGFRLTFLESDAYAVRFGDLARAGAGRDEFLGAVGLHCRSLDTLRQCAKNIPELKCSESGGYLDLAIDACDTLLWFEQ